MAMLLLLSSLLVLCALGVAAYRLTLHPLASFPGPKLAALSSLYWAYFDLFYAGGGEMLHQMEYLHSVYGPVVRMAPNALHFADPKAYADIYRMGTDIRKHAGLYDYFDQQESVFGLIDPAQHKERRAVMNPLFQRRAVIRMEHVLHEKMNRFIGKLNDAVQEGPINMHYAFRAITVDFITAYSFGKSAGCIDTPGFRHPLIVEMAELLAGQWLPRWIPLVDRIMKNMHPSVAYALIPAARPLLDLIVSMSADVDEYIKNPEKLRQGEHETIFSQFLQTDKPTHRSRNGILQEARLLAFAGSDTIAQTCYTGYFFALANPMILAKLRHELDAAWPDANAEISFQVLENLPYLTAFIKESLRMSSAVPSFLERISEKPMAIAGVQVPPQTVVSMSVNFVHFNAECFENPHQFNPDRWLDPKESLDQWLVAFSRGSRMCVGMHLAWAELYLILANVVRKFDIEIHDTSSKDIMEFKQYFSPSHTGKDFHALVKNARK